MTTPKDCTIILTGADRKLLEIQLTVVGDNMLEQVWAIGTSWITGFIKYRRGYDNAAHVVIAVLHAYAVEEYEKFNVRRLALSKEMEEENAHHNPCKFKSGGYLKGCIIRFGRNNRKFKRFTESWGGQVERAIKTMEEHGWPNTTQGLPVWPWVDVTTNT